MKFGQLIEYDVRNIFLQKSCGKGGRETTADLYLFFENALYELKANGQHLNLKICWYF